MRRCFALLVTSLYLSVASGETPSRQDVAKEFAFCYVYFLVVAAAAPPYESFKAQAESIREQAFQLGAIAVLLTDRAFLNSEAEAAKERIRTMPEANRGAEIARHRTDCENLPSKHEVLIASLYKEVQDEKARKAAAELPPFDQEKARTLSPEKRRQYDVVFFNEIETWNVNSNRYVTDSSQRRREEFKQMAQDGYLPAYAALRLAGIWPATRRHDPEALKMLMSEAERGDASAMCAVVVIPRERSNWEGKDELQVVARYMRESAARGHGGCMAWYGGALLLGNLPDIPQARKTAMPMLLESARQGYYVAVKRLFGIRYSKALKQQFDFSDRAELERAICWGRLAQQHSNWAGFDAFLYVLRDYARENGRADLMEQSYRFDPKRVPITDRVIKPEHCIPLEQSG